jgi:hypothetical protein
MVFKIIGVPFKGILPFGDNLCKTAGIEFSLEPLNDVLVCFHVLEGKDHIELAPVRITQFPGISRSNEDRLAHCETVISIQYIAPELLKYLMCAFL